jgi:hypothetical protein
LPEFDSYVHVARSMDVGSQMLGGSISLFSMASWLNIGSHLDVVSEVLSVPMSSIGVCCRVD